MSRGLDDDGRDDAPGTAEFYTTFTSLALIRLARNGDRAALDALFARHLPRLRRWARGRLWPKARGCADTTDVVQDAAMNVFARLDQFEPRHRGALQAYLRQAVANRIKDEHRRVTRRPEMQELTPDVADDRRDSPLDSAIAREIQDRYQAALVTLKPADQQAVVARIELGYTYEQIALMLEKPTPDAARLAVSRALLRVAAHMDELRPSQ